MALNGKEDITQLIIDENLFRKSSFTNPLQYFQTLGFFLIFLFSLFFIDISTPLPDHEMSYNTVYGQFMDLFFLILQATHPVVVYSFHS